MRLIHWTSAPLVAGTLGLGAWMVEAVDDPAQRFDLTQTHKSLGIAVLALTAARLCLRLMTVAPKQLPVAPRLVIAARTAHVGLYAVLLLLPLSGWLMATTAPVRIPTVVFGLFTWPYPLAPHEQVYRFARTLHAAAAIAMTALIAVHAAAALVHALWWRDGVLARMCWKRRR
jgi:cytochrome b561